MKTDVLVVGEGVLADHVHGDLSGQYQVNRQTDFEAGIPQRRLWSLCFKMLGTPRSIKRRKR